MFTYCFRCPSCGTQSSASTRDETLVCGPCLRAGSTVELKRDYRAENAGIGQGVRESRREMTNSGYRDLFLPTAEDMRSPDDPDGQKGLRKWAEEHAPAESNKRPLYPEMEKRQF